MLDKQRLPIFSEQIPDFTWIRRGNRVYMDPSLKPLLKFCVYRYASIPEAIALTANRQWSFARPDSWPDKYEQHIGNELFGKAGPFSNVAAYVKCVSLEYSSEAMWRTYATSSGLARIGLRLDKLIDGLDTADWPTDAKIYVGRTRYMEQSSIRKEVSLLLKNPPKPVSRIAMHALLMKRAGFSYENEIRICFLSKSETDRPQTRDVTRFSANISRMLLDPYLKQWQAKVLQNLFEKIVSVPFKVSQSAFDSHP